MTKPHSETKNITKAYPWRFGVDFAKQIGAHHLLASSSLTRTHQVVCSLLVSWGSLRENIRVKKSNKFNEIWILSDDLVLTPRIPQATINRRNFSIWSCKIKNLAKNRWSDFRAFFNGKAFQNMWRMPLSWIKAQLLPFCPHDRLCILTSIFPIRWLVYKLASQNTNLSD